MLENSTFYPHKFSEREVKITYVEMLFLQKLHALIILYFQEF